MFSDRGSIPLDSTIGRKSEHNHRFRNGFRPNQKTRPAVIGGACSCFHLSVRMGMDIPELDTEGRLITLEYPDFFFLTCYTPNAQQELVRIDYRIAWEDAFFRYLQSLDQKTGHSLRRPESNAIMIHIKVKSIRISRDLIVFSLP